MNVDLSDRESADTSRDSESRDGRRRIILTVLAAMVVLAIVGVFAYGWAGRARREQEGLLRATLERLVTAQEGFYYDSAHYVSSLRSLPGMRVSPQVQLRITTPSSKSWWASATYAGRPGRQCVVWVGAPPPSLSDDARAPENETKPFCFDDAGGDR